MTDSELLERLKKETGSENVTFDAEAIGAILGGDWKVGAEAIERLKSRRQLARVSDDMWALPEVADRMTS